MIRYGATDEVVDAIGDVVIVAEPDVPTSRENGQLSLRDDCSDSARGGSSAEAVVLN